MSATIGRVCCVGDRGLPVVSSRKKQALSGFQAPAGAKLLLPFTAPEFCTRQPDPMPALGHLLIGAQTGSRRFPAARPNGSLRGRCCRLFGSSSTIAPPLLRFALGLCSVRLPVLVLDFPNRPLRSHSAKWRRAKCPEQLRPRGSSESAQRLLLSRKYYRKSLVSNATDPADSCARRGMAPGGGGGDRGYPTRRSRTPSRCR